jgi:Lar family restriction alleviation protein
MKMIKPKGTLLSCPFCGGKAELGIMEHNIPAVMCYNCGAFTSFMQQETVDKTLKAWNRRVMPC